MGRRPIAAIACGNPCEILWGGAPPMQHLGTAAFALLMAKAEADAQSRAHQRTADRQGYASGLKPKTIHTRRG